MENSDVLFEEGKNPSEFAECYNLSHSFMHSSDFSAARGLAVKAVKALEHAEGREGSAKDTADLFTEIEAWERRSLDRS